MRTNKKTTSERREKIISLIKEFGAVQVSDLAESFDVSTVTIRGDLTFVEKLGVATRTYGGALLCDFPKTTEERTVAKKQTENLSIKKKIAKLASTLVRDGHSIILDSGTTTYELALEIKERKGVTVMTNGMNVANALVDASGVELLVTGGCLRRSSMSFYGSQAERSLDNYHFDMVFLGVDGLSLTQGITTHHENEARINRHMCNASKRVIAVTDASKFNHVSLHRIIETEKIDVLVTDSNITDVMLSGLEKLGIEVLVAE